MDKKQKKMLTKLNFLAHKVRCLSFLLLLVGVITAGMGIFKIAHGPKRHKNNHRDHSIPADPIWLQHEAENEHNPYYQSEDQQIELMNNLKEFSKEYEFDLNDFKPVEMNKNDLQPSLDFETLKAQYEDIIKQL